MHLSGPGGTDPGYIRPRPGDRSTHCLSGPLTPDQDLDQGDRSTHCLSGPLTPDQDLDQGDRSTHCLSGPLTPDQDLDQGDRSTHCLSGPLTPDQDLDQGDRSTHCLSGPLTPDQDLDQGNRSTHCLSGPLTPDQNLVRATLSLSLSDELSSEEAICQSTISHYGEEDEDSVHRFRRRCEEERDEEEEEECKEEEDQYDILPAPRNSEYHINQSDEDLTDGEDLYDFPLSNSRASDRQDYSEMTESIYDVPSSLMRKMSEHTLAEPYPGGEILVEDRGLLDDMMAGLGGGTVGWITGASTGSVEPYGLAHHGS
ncbi:uncharacterized protein [Salmo salar]|uniref:Uncharacterized protein n=1 Tax=Salmo salar TaxID=8030 RepID=A0ABM3ELT7_SALSA|nr:uncharacterized protein LOC106601819 [Salmo salar]